MHSAGDGARDTTLQSVITIPYKISTELLLFAGNSGLLKYLAKTHDICKHNSIKNIIVKLSNYSYDS